MYCPKCGKELRDGAAFCNGCGVALSESDANVQNVCITTNASDIVSRSVKKVMIIFAVVALLFNIIARIILIGNITPATFVNIFVWSIVPSALLILFTSLLNKKNPALMSIPLIFPLVMGLVDILAYRASFNISQVLIYFFDLLFIIFSIITIVSRNKATKIVAIISLTIYKLISVLNYISVLSYGPLSFSERRISQVFFLVWCIADAIVWFLFLIGIKFKSNRSKQISENVFSTQTIMFCPNCGNHFPLGKKFCDQCGNELKETVINNTTRNQYNPQDSKSTGFGVLGFFFPAIGLILYLVWKDSMPLRAKSTGKGALAGAITWVALTILIYVVYFIIIASLF